MKRIIKAFRIPIILALIIVAPYVLIFTYEALTVGLVAAYNHGVHFEDGAFALAISTAPIIAHSDSATLEYTAGYNYYPMWKMYVGDFAFNPSDDGRIDMILHGAPVTYQHDQVGTLKDIVVSMTDAKLTRNLSVNRCYNYTSGADYAIGNDTASESACAGRVYTVRTVDYTGKAIVRAATLEVYALFATLNLFTVLVIPLAISTVVSVRTVARMKEE